MYLFIRIHIENHVLQSPGNIEVFKITLYIIKKVEEINYVHEQL